MAGSFWEFCPLELTILVCGTPNKRTVQLFRQGDRIGATNSLLKDSESVVIELTLQEDLFSMMGKNIHLFTVGV